METPTSVSARSSAPRGAAAASQAPAAVAGPPQKQNPDTLLGKHLAHIREHLGRLRDGHANVHDPERMFLGHEEGEHFWELIGVCLTGHTSPILGVTRFRRHNFPGEAYARESLATYLSNPGAHSSGGVRANHGGLGLVLPRVSDEVPDFLRLLRTGRLPHPVTLDPTRIEVAFDFRMHNPYVLNALRNVADPLRKRLFRTVRGHVLTGLSHDPMDPHDPGDFLAVKDPIQHTPKGKLSLPHLAVNRRFIAISADVTEAQTRLAAPQWVPFAPTLGVGRHLLTS